MTKLIVPGVRDEEPTYVCRVPVNANGDICGQLFYADEARDWQSHVGRCARANRQAIEEASHARKDPLYEAWDPEVAEHMQKVGERMIHERRLEVKPNERAGFS